LLLKRANLGASLLEFRTLFLNLGGFFLGGIHLARVLLSFFRAFLLPSRLCPVAQCHSEFASSAFPLCLQVTS
jgi:hypothetical protein